MLTEEVGKRMLGHLLFIIKGISDKEYQRRVWIRIEGPEVGDFTETVCKFFDMGEPVLNNYKTCGLTRVQYQILKEFADTFGSFSDEHDYEPDFIDTPEWDEITKMAAEVLKAFDYNHEVLTNTVDKNILNACLQDICDMSHKEYQEKVWILAEGDDDNGNCSRFFDKADLILQNYKDFGITESQYQILKKFRDRYYAFSRAHFWPPEFIDTPEWTEIRENAKEVLKAFNYKP